MTIKNLTYEEKIIIMMKRKNITWQKLADEVGISIGYLRDIVKGNRLGAEHLIKVEKILDLK